MRDGLYRTAAISLPFWCLIYKTCTSSRRPYTIPPVTEQITFRHSLLWTTLKLSFSCSSFIQTDESLVDDIIKWCAAQTYWTAIAFHCSPNCRKPTMGFDLYSYDVPADHQAPIVKRYFRCMHESGNLSPFDLSIATNLHTRANNSDWSKLVHIIERSVDGSILDAPVAHRCYKPDEDDYSLFTGDAFSPKGMPKSQWWFTFYFR